MNIEALFITVCLPICCQGAVVAQSLHQNLPADSLIVSEMSPLDSIMAEMNTDNVIHRLCEDDFRAVAEELGVEVPAIKAVVEIEAGKSHKGFSAPGKPVINFDLAMFKRFAARNGVNLSKHTRSHTVVFSAPQIRKYGSQQAAQHARLEQAYSIHRRSAIEGTFWGMFQIGGFNWKKCGATDIDEFVERMSRSEHEQLELFARFIETSGLTKYLKTKNWRAFARGYNGPSYAKRGYHTRLANAYAKYLAQSKKAEQMESTR